MPGTASVRLSLPNQPSRILPSADLFLHTTWARFTNQPCPRFSLNADLVSIRADGCQQSLSRRKPAKSQLQSLQFSSPTMPKRTWSQSNEHASENGQTTPMSPTARQRPSEPAADMPAPSISRKVKACAACRKQKVRSRKEVRACMTNQRNTDQMYHG